MLAGQHQAAARRFARAIECDPDSAAAHSSLGLARLECGFGDEAVLDCRRATELRPSDPEMLFNLGVVLEAGGRLQEAETKYRETLERAPAHGKARLNLATVLHRMGMSAAAVDCLQEGRANFRPATPFSRNLGHVYLAMGLLGDAAECFTEVLRAAPDDQDALAGLAAARRRQGDPEAALAACAEIGTTPPSPDLSRQKGIALLSLGRLDEAIQAFELALDSKRRPGDFSQVAADQLETSLAKLQHDCEQLAWLEEHELLAPAWAGAPSALSRVLSELPADTPAASVFNLPFSARRRIQGFYNRMLYRSSPAALEGGSVNPGLEARDVEADYRRNGPGMTVVDNFLRPEAVLGLRRFCQESTFWFDFYHPHGYLGAYLEEGFQCPLLLQVAEDLRALLPGVIGDLPLRQMWAYKYDSRLEGIDMHADFAAVNVNFWITPESANLDSDSGGMLVWDKEAPDDWDFEQYNSSTGADQQRIAEFLEASGAQAQKIPYRENRAVIFNSDLFHKTDQIRFASGYENRRINITMLFGTRGESAA